MGLLFLAALASCTAKDLSAQRPNVTIQLPFVLCRRRLYESHTHKVSALFRTNTNYAIEPPNLHLFLNPFSISIVYADYAAYAQKDKRYKPVREALEKVQDTNQSVNDQLQVAYKEREYGRD